MSYSEWKQYKNSGETKTTQTTTGYEAWREYKYGEPTVTKTETKGKTSSTKQTTTPYSQTAEAANNRDAKRDETQSGKTVTGVPLFTTEEENQTQEKQSIFKRIGAAIGSAAIARGQAEAEMANDDYLSPAEAAAMSFAKSTGAIDTAAAIGSAVSAVTGNEQTAQRNADVYKWAKDTVQQANEEQKVASTIGSVAGDVALITAIGGGVGKLATKATTKVVGTGADLAVKGAAEKATSTFANKAIGAAVKAATTATTFAAKTAVQNVGSVTTGNTSGKDYRIEILTSAASGAAFGIVDSVLSAGGTEILTGLNNKKTLGIDWTSPFAWFTKEVAAGMAGAGASIATDLALATPDEEYTAAYKAMHPYATDETVKASYKEQVKKNIGKQMLMMFFFTMISAGKSTANEIAKTRSGMALVEEYLKTNFTDEYMAKAEQYSKMSAEERIAFAKETIARVNTAEGQLESLFSESGYYGVGLNADGKRIYSALENIKSIAETDLKPYSSTGVTTTGNTEYASNIMRMITDGAGTPAVSGNAVAQSAAKASSPTYMMPTATTPGQFASPVANTSEVVYNNAITTKEADNGGRDLRLSGGSQRVPGQSPIEQAGLVEGQAGGTSGKGSFTGENSAAYFGSNGKAESAYGGQEIKIDAANAKDKGVGGITISRVVDASEISTKLKKGTKLAIVSGKDTPAMATARKRANNAGLEIVFVAGGDIVSADDGTVARGCLVSVNKKGIKIICRVDDKYADADQLSRHEIGHDYVNTGKLTPRQVIEDFRKTSATKMM